MGFSIFNCINFQNTFKLRSRTYLHFLILIILNGTLNFSILPTIFRDQRIISKKSDYRNPKILTYHSRAHFLVATPFTRVSTRYRLGFFVTAERKIFIWMAWTPGSSWTFALGYSSDYLSFLYRCKIVQLLVKRRPVIIVWLLQLEN